MERPLAKPSPGEGRDKPSPQRCKPPARTGHRPEHQQMRVNYIINSYTPITYLERPRFRSTRRHLAMNSRIVIIPETYPIKDRRATHSRLHSVLRVPLSPLFLPCRDAGQNMVAISLFAFVHGWGIVSIIRTSQRLHGVGKTARGSTQRTGTGEGD